MSAQSRLLTIARYSLLEALRDRFLLLILAGLFLFFLVSVFVGELAITESVAMQISILAYSLRLFVVFAISLFVITSMLREFNDKGFELILSHPITRASYFAGKFSGYAIISLLVSFCVMCCLLVYMQDTHVIYWSFSLFCELLIIVALSLLCLFTLNSITLSFTFVFGFYILARSIEIIQLISQAPLLASSSISHQFISTVIDLLAYLIPDLYLYTKTEWLIYGMQSVDEMSPVFVQTLIYLCLLSAAALFDLYRKEL